MHVPKLFNINYLIIHCVSVVSSFLYSRTFSNYSNNSFYLNYYCDHVKILLQLILSVIMISI